MTQYDERYHKVLDQRGAAPGHSEPPRKNYSKLSFYIIFVTALVAIGWTIWIAIPNRSGRQTQMMAVASAPTSTNCRSTNCWVPIQSATDTEYSLIDGAVFYDGTRVAFANSDTFLVAQDPVNRTGTYKEGYPLTYAKDKSHVYFGHGWGIDIERVETGADVINGADPNTFVPIYDSKGYFADFGRDANHIYYEGSVFRPGNKDVSIDPQSFTVLPSGDPPNSYVAFSKDKNHVYTVRGVLDNADATAFRVFGVEPTRQNADPVNRVYGCDDQNIFESSLSGLAIIGTLTGNGDSRR